MKLIIIGCSKKKQEIRCIAAQMYSASVLFNKSFLYATILRNQQPKETIIQIASAEYGLMDLEQVIDSYNRELNKDIFQIFQMLVKIKLKKLSNAFSINEVLFLCGKKYSDAIKAVFFFKTSYIEPFLNLGIGHRLKFLDKEISKYLESVGTFR